MGELEKIGADLDREKIRSADADSELQRINNELVEARAQELEAKSQLGTRQSNRLSVEEKLQSSRVRLASLNTEKAQLQARLEELKNRLDSQRERLGAAEQAISQAENSVALAETELTDAIKGRESAQLASNNSEQMLAGINHKVSALESRRQQHLEEKNGKLAELARLQAQLDVLDQAELSLDAYSDGARTLLDASRNSRIGGVRGALSAVLDVPGDFETAISAALGDSLDAVIVSMGSDVEAALLLLDSDSSGRATLLPLDWLNSRKPIKVGSDPAIVGVASQVLKSPDDILPVVEFLLGQTIIVRDRTHARRILKSSGAQRVVTLKGEVFRADGPIQAGRENRSGSISRPRQRREIKDSLAGLQSSLAELNQSIERIISEHSVAQMELDFSDQSMKESRTRFAEANSLVQQTELAIGSARQKLEWQIAQKQTLSEELMQAEEERTKLTSAQESLEASLTLAQDEIRTINGELISLDLDEFNNQVVFWNTRAQVSERSLQEAGNASRSGNKPRCS
jgi:chromosome segregation protein